MNTSDSTVTCPDCRQPAVVLDRFDLPSTTGPVEYLRIRCSGWLSLIVAAAEVREPISITDRRARRSGG